MESTLRDTAEPGAPQLQRHFGLLHATALNVTMTFGAFARILVSRRDLLPTVLAFEVDHEADYENCA